MEGEKTCHALVIGVQYDISAPSASGTSDTTCLLCPLPQSAVKRLDELFKNDGVFRQLSSGTGSLQGASKLLGNCGAPLHALHAALHAALLHVTKRVPKPNCCISCVLRGTELVASLLKIINGEVTKKKSLDANLSGAFKRAVQLACDERRTGSIPTSGTVAALPRRHGGLATITMLPHQSQS